MDTNYCASVSYKPRTDTSLNRLNPVLAIKGNHDQGNNGNHARDSAFDIGMEWISKLKAKIVCFEKILQIPLFNREILEFHGERPEGKLKQLMTIKVDELKLEDIPVVRDSLPCFRKIYQKCKNCPTNLKSSKKKVSYDLALNLGEPQSCLLRRRMVHSCMSIQFYSRQIKLHFPNPEKSLQFHRVEESESDNLFHDHIQGEDEHADDVQMADHLRPMEELLRIPIVGIENAIVVPAILADEFELKTELLDFVSNNSFFGLENDDPHSHIRRFYQITQTLRLNQVSDDVVKLILFPFSLKGAAEK
ncbi:hypothetical protein Tco_0318997 [Tanacetum coccineum]